MVSEEWVRLAGFANGVLEHVISMDSGCGFVPVPEGVKILMNTRKVQSEIRAAHCTMGLRLGGSPCKSTKTGQGRKARNAEKDCN